MNTREQVAVFLLNRDEGGDCLEWATGFLTKCANEPHEGDCPHVKFPAPFTCSRCVCDRALADADTIIALACGQHED